MLRYFVFFLQPPSSPETPTSSMAPPSSTPSYAPQSASTQSSTADTLSESTINLKRELEVNVIFLCVFYLCIFSLFEPPLQIIYNESHSASKNVCRHSHSCPQCPSGVDKYGRETIVELVKKLGQESSQSNHLFLVPRPQLLKVKGSLGNENAADRKK